MNRMLKPNGKLLISILIYPITYEDTAIKELILKEFMDTMTTVEAVDSIIINDLRK